MEASKDGGIISCPKGHAPVSSKKKKTRHIAAFDIQCCSNCSLQRNCPVKQGKKNYYLRYTDKEMRLAKRKAYEQTEEFKDRYRWRSGVEATMSEYDRRTGVKHLRVRGLKSVRYSATLKAVGINIFRAVAVVMALIGSNVTFFRQSCSRNYQVVIFKEQILGSISSMLEKWMRFTKYYKYVTFSSA